MRSLDLFSCIGCHAVGFKAAGIKTAHFCEINPWRRRVLERHFPFTMIHDDIRTLKLSHKIEIAIGGPPCQRTSVAAAIHGKRSGESLWPHMLRVGLNVGANWIVVEQPPGNAIWEAEVADDLSRNRYHVAKFEFGACDLGAPYIRRRVFLVASTSLPRLEVAWRAIPPAIESVKRAANARGDWSADQLGAIRVDAGPSSDVDRRERIEALGDSNPPHMAEVIGRAIMATQ